MAQAIFHSLRGEKSALILVKANALVFNNIPVYVPREAVVQLSGRSMDELSKHNPKEAVINFQIPDGYRIESFVDPETGEIRKTNEGEELKVLVY